MTQEELNKILDLHQKWTKGEEGGVRADLSYLTLAGLDLSGVNLSRAHLRNADMSGTCLSHANLSFADFVDANFHHANLSHANLFGADLQYARFSDVNLQMADLLYANLSCAKFSGTDLCYANLNHANLHGAFLMGSNLRGSHLTGTILSNAALRDTDLTDVNLLHAVLVGAGLRYAKNIPYIPLACPSDGSFIGWKKVGNCLIKLEIPEDAKRSSATTAKCRCDKARVLSIVDLLTNEEVQEIVNTAHTGCIYKTGEMVYPDSFNENRWHECSHGIHFFINKQDAINYQ